MFCLILTPTVLLADTYSGRIVGGNCAAAGHLCPAKQFDQHLTGEPRFVLMTSSNQVYHLNNITRDTLIRYVSTRVLMEATLAADGKTLNVTELRVQRGDGLSRYESVWAFNGRPPMMQKKKPELKSEPEKEMN